MSQHNKMGLPKEVAEPMAKALIDTENHPISPSGNTQERASQIIGVGDWKVRQIYDHAERLVKATGRNAKIIQAMRLSDEGKSIALTPEIEKGGQRGLIKNVLMGTNTQEKPTVVQNFSNQPQDQGNGGSQ